MATAPPPNPLPPNRDIGSLLEITSYVFIFPTIITTALRLWVRIREKTVGVDDITIVLSAALAVVISALSIEAVKDGKGRHVWYLSDRQQAQIGMLSWINQIVLFCCICSIKTSICLLILRIKNTKRLKLLIFGIITLLVITNIVPIIALLVECHPIYKFWDRTSAKGSCIAPDFRIYSIYVQSAYSILTDLICSILPVFIVWQLQLSLRKKIGVCVLMSLGLVCTAFAGLRAASLSTNISDTTWTYTYTGTWMTIEVNLGIIAANLAPLRALMVRFFPAMLSRGSHRQYGSNAYGLPTHNTNTLQSGAGYYQNDASFKEDGPRRESSFTSDRSEIPLKQVLQTKEVRVDYSDMQSNWEGVDNVDQRQWGSRC